MNIFGDMAKGPISVVEPEILVIRNRKSWIRDFIIILTKTAASQNEVVVILECMGQIFSQFLRPLL